MKRVISILAISVVLILAMLCITSCGNDKTADNTNVPTPTPTVEPTATPDPNGEEETTGGLVVDPIGQDGWPAAFLLFPKYSGEGELISTDVNEANTVMTRVYTGLTEYSVANYQDQLRKQDFVSNANADFLKSMDTTVLTWSYTVNGSNGQVTFIWKIGTTENN
ncbi:MAG: hypothetical protein IKV30_01000 [Clostridia bacterium]|nr:hypothetical protein [Clostridia bacterium]